jgi:hypothetical protein
MSESAIKKGDFVSQRDVKGKDSKYNISEVLKTTPAPQIVSRVAAANLPVDNTDNNRQLSRRRALKLRK